MSALSRKGGRNGEQSICYLATGTVRIHDLSSECSPQHFEESMTISTSQMKRLMPAEVRQPSGGALPPIAR